MMLELGYMALTLMMFIIIMIIGTRTISKTFIDKAVAKKKRLQLFISMLIWQGYVFFIASTGILQNYELPPRFVILLVLPTFIFTGIFIYKNRNNQWIQNIPGSTLVYYQSFRLLIETLFVFSVAQDILHKNVTLEGYNYDMIFAITAPIVAFLVFNKKLLSKKVALVWNYFGLAVIAFIIFLFVTTTFFPGFYGSDVPLMPMEFATYPYMLVAGFLMPSAVFMHVLSIVQLSKRSNP
jgi:hypothetical protein